jgi:hypothetical protein
MLLLFLSGKFNISPPGADTQDIVARPGVSNLAGACSGKKKMSFDR